MMKKKNGLMVKKGVLEILSDHPARIGEMERALNKSKETVEDAIAVLRKDGHNIIVDSASGRYQLKQGLRSSFEAISRETFYTGNVLRKLGVSETHLGGRHSQPHFVPICAAVVRSKEFGVIHLVGHYGDVFNGLKHKDYSRGENILNTADLQMEAGIEVLPCFEYVPVFIRPGDHDMWQYSDVGLNMVKNAIRIINLERKVAGKEPNFHYVGSDEGDQVMFKGFVLEFKHIMSAQARGLTTKAQYMFEDRIGDFVRELRGESGTQSNLAQPDHIGCGNWHREISFFHGGTAIDLYPGFQASTTWEKQMGIVHKFGAKIVTLEKDKYGNIFRYDVRYLDFSNMIKVISSAKFEENSLGLALEDFRKFRRQLQESVEDKDTKAKK